MQLDSNKKGSSKALIFVHTFKCKIAADIQHGICTKKSTKILSPSCLGSCQFICPLPFPSVHCLVVPVKSEKQWEEVLAVSWRRRSSCASRGKHLPPLAASGLVAGRGAHTRCLPSVAFCAERAHVCVRGAAGVRPPCRSVGILQAGAVQSPSPARRRGKCGMC